MAGLTDERREVAARLRHCARDVNGTRDFSMYLSHWVGFDGITDDKGNPFTIQANRRKAELTLEKLADLIDPTCEVAPFDEEIARRGGQQGEEGGRAMSDTPNHKRCEVHFVGREGFDVSPCDTGESLVQLLRRLDVAGGWLSVDGALVNLNNVTYIREVGR